MVGKLLLRGMLVGIVAGLLSFGFAKVFGEPSVARAIAFEAQMEAAKGETPEAELVSRDVQAGPGLLVGAVVYGAAIGGLFALVFAYAYGRVGSLGARETAALVALAGFIAVILVPFIKYPANPPSVGDPETIGKRTVAGLAYVIVIAVVQLILPTINEVPEHFSAVVLWQFRIGSLGIHAVLWTCLGLVFGALTERSFAARPRVGKQALMR